MCFSLALQEEPAAHSGLCPPSSLPLRFLAKHTLLSQLVIKNLLNFYRACGYRGVKKLSTLLSAVARIWVPLLAVGTMRFGGDTVLAPLSAQELP